MNAQPLDYSLWTEILQKYVSDNGAVNYKYLKNNKSAFESYLKLLSASAPNEDCSVDIKKANAIDCGCGYGWFSFAYILSGGKHITMVEPDVKRLAIVKDIASILGITTDSASFINSSIPFSSPLASVIVDGLI